MKPFKYVTSEFFLPFFQLYMMFTVIVLNSQKKWSLNFVDPIYPFMADCISFTNGQVSIGESFYVSNYRYILFNLETLLDFVLFVVHITVVSESF